MAMLPPEPLKIEFHEDKLLINSKVKWKAKLIVGSSEFEVELKKGKNEIELNAGEGVKVETKAKLCVEGYCEEFPVVIRSDFALHDVDNDMLYVRTKWEWSKLKLGSISKNSGTTRLEVK